MAPTRQDDNVQILGSPNRIGIFAGGAGLFGPDRDGHIRTTRRTHEILDRCISSLPYIVVKADQREIVRIKHVSRATLHPQARRRTRLKRPPRISTREHIRVLTCRRERSELRLCVQEEMIPVFRGIPHVVVRTIFVATRCFDAGRSPEQIFRVFLVRWSHHLIGTTVRQHTRHTRRRRRKRLPGAFAVAHTGSVRRDETINIRSAGRQASD